MRYTVLDDEAGQRHIMFTRVGLDQDTGLLTVGIVILSAVSCFQSVFYTVLTTTVLIITVWYCAKRKRTDNSSSSDGKTEINTMLVKELRDYKQKRNELLHELSNKENIQQENEKLHLELGRKIHESDKQMDNLRMLEKIQKNHEVERLQYEDNLKREKEKNQKQKEEMRREKEEMMARYENEKRENAQTLFELKMQIETFMKDNHELQQQLHHKSIEKQSFEEKAYQELQRLQNAVQINSNKLQQSELHIGTLNSHLQHTENKKEEYRQKYKEQITRVDVQQKRIEELEVLLTAASSPTEQTHICNICEERERNICLVPCGHTLCMVCATEITSRNNKCPHCRKYIEKKINVFLN